MPLFSRRRNVFADVQASKWSNDAERKELLDQLKESKLRQAEVIELFWHRDGGVRGVAAERFLDKVSSDDVVRLVKEGSGKPRHVKAYLERVYARVPPKVMVSAIEDMLGAKDPSDRRTGWELALAMPGEERQRYLARACTEAPKAMRPTALQRLLQGGTPAAHKALLLELAGGEDARMATAALQSLAEMQGPEVVDAMIAAFAGQDATQREIAGRYMRAAAKKDPAGMRNKMLALLSGGEDATRRMSVEILLETGDAAKVLEDILVSSAELVGWLRTRILETLQTFGDRVLKPALGLLDHPDEQVRTAALVLAEQFNDPRLVAPVAKLLQDDDWWLRVIACETLGRLGDERAVGPLVQALGDDDTRWAAIDALANIGSPKALKPMTQLLRSDRVEVRREVVRALGKFSDPRIIGLLEKIAQRDASTELRTLASEQARDISARLNVEHKGGEVASSVSASSLRNPVDRLLAGIREMGASDLHLSVGEPPLLRRQGKLERMEGMKPLSEEAVRRSVLSTLNERQKGLLKEHGEVDYCYAIPEVGRYRANAFEQRLGLCATFRVIPNTPPTFADLRLPGHLTELLDYHQGIIVLSGPAGSGKSTTLTALINLINESKPEHILTIEDPVEFVHPVKNSLINQREVGGHTGSFARALRGALRQDPDVIVVGDLRDPDVTRMALTAAETGHLVIATMHTTSAVQTVERLITSFPPDEQQQVRMALSESLKYVISQQLIPRKDGEGRIAIFEVLKGTSSIGNLIRDNKSYQIPSMMQIGSRVGMQTVDMALMELYEAGLVSAENAWLKATKQETFEPWCDPDFLAQAKVDTGDDKKAKGGEA